MQAEKQSEIPDLRKARADGTPYVRRPEIQDAIEDLYALPIEDVANRAQNIPEGNKHYVPTECVVHFVRRSLDNGDAKPYMVLFQVLRDRVTRLVPVSYRRKGSDQYLPTSSYAADLREKVLDSFLKLLCEDREDYNERLDFYEIRFNMAIAKLKASAKKSLTRRRKREKQVEYDENSPSLTTEMTARIASVQDSSTPEEIFFRFELLQAIDQLPPDQRRVIELIHFEGMPIDSKSPETQSVAKVLGCTEKTVRNRRDRAYIALREALGEEGSE